MRIKAAVGGHVLLSTDARGAALGGARERSLLVVQMTLGMARGGLIGIALALLPLHAVEAQTDGRRVAVDDDVWEVSVTPYFWGMEIDGNIDADRVDADFDASFSDIWDNTNFSLMAALEARRDRFVTLVDVFGAELEADDSTAFGFDADSELRQLVIDGKVGWRVLEIPHRNYARNQLDLDLLVGARYQRYRTEIERGTIFGEFEDHERSDWIDALVGMGVRSQLSETIAFRAIGDIGGFGIGSSSRFTWQLFAGLSAEVASRWVFSAGYKVLDNDRDDAVDVQFRGPMVGVTYRFSSPYL
jgi:outer membrane receptor protein involved in Fe transport